MCLVDGSSRINSAIHKAAGRPAAVQNGLLQRHSQSCRTACHRTERSFTALFTKPPYCLPSYRTVSYSAIHKATRLPAAVQNGLLQRYSQSRQTACRRAERSLTALFTKPPDCLPPCRTVSYSAIHKAAGLPAAVQNGLLQCYSQSRRTACCRTERSLTVLFTKPPDCLPPYRTVSYSAIHKAAGLSAAIQNSLLQHYSQSRWTVCHRTEQSLTVLFTKPPDCLLLYRTVSYSAIHKAARLPATVQNSLLQRYSQSRRTVCCHTEQSLTALFTKPLDCLPPYRTVSYSAIHKAAGLSAAVQNSLLQHYSQSRWTVCHRTERSLTALFTKPVTACRRGERPLDTTLYSGSPIDIFPFCRELLVTKEPATL